MRTLHIFNSCLQNGPFWDPRWPNIHLGVEQKKAQFSEVKGGALIQNSTSAVEPAKIQHLLFIFQLKISAYGRALSAHGRALKDKLKFQARAQNH